MRPIFRKSDLFLSFCLLFAAILVLLFVNLRQDTCVAVIEQNGEPVREIDLSRQTETETLDLGGAYHVRLLIEPGAVSFLSSDCRDHTCIRTGRLTRPGQSAVCLPARISVRLTGKKDAADAVTG